MRFAGLTLEFAILQAQLIELRAQAGVFGVSAAQADVVGPDAAGVRDGVGTAALERHHDGRGPVADQAHVVVALDLEGEQQNLRQHEGGEQEEDVGERWIRSC